MDFQRNSWPTATQTHKLVTLLWLDIIFQAVQVTAPSNTIFIFRRLISRKPPTSLSTAASFIFMSQSQRADFYDRYSEWRMHGVPYTHRYVYEMRKSHDTNETLARGRTSNDLDLDQWPWPTNLTEIERIRVMTPNRSNAIFYSEVIVRTDTRRTGRTTWTTKTVRKNRLARCRPNGT